MLEFIWSGSLYWNLNYSWIDLLKDHFWNSIFILNIFKYLKIDIYLSYGGKLFIKNLSIIITNSFIAIIIYFFLTWLSFIRKGLIFIYCSMSCKYNFKYII